MKKIFFCLILLILSFQLISATETVIKVKTVPFKNINLIVLSSSLEIYGSFNKDADKYGDASFLFSSDKSRFDVTIFIKDVDLDKKIAYKKLENQIAGEDIYVEVVPEDFTIVKTPGEEIETEIVENVSLNDSIISLQEEPIQKPRISGYAIFGENTKLRNIILYSLGGVIILLIAFFIFKKVKKRNKGEKGIKIRKLSELRSEEKTLNKDDTPQNYYGILNNTQKKLEETQKELDKVKNREKIKEIERRIQKDQQELRKLKSF
ncbi:MAG TPA: hypothetical protein PK357_02340 [Candidatus Pacearchaeota archaeon]|nr:hypothetical protein [Candidatus Pacearchaeota archaeon]